MDELWYPKAIRLEPRYRNGLSLTDTFNRKIVLHTTESYEYNPSVEDFYGHQYWPNATGPDEYGNIYQHLPTNKAGYALRRGVNGETNRDGVFQIEIPWKAANAALMPQHMLNNLGDFLSWLMGELDIPPVAPAFVGSEGYGKYARQRFSAPEFDNFSGICGHQHVPSLNDHWDPGKINIKYLLEYITQEEVEVSPRDWCKFVQVERNGQLEGPVFLVNLATEEIDGVEPGINSDHAVRDDFGRVFGLDTTIHKVDPMFIKQFKNV